MSQIQVLKIGGHQLDDADFLAGLARYVAHAGRPIVIVHGGGRAIAEAQARYGLVERKVEGLRVTDPLTMQVVEMALSGHANKRIVAALMAAGVDAMGLSGVDRGLLRGELKRHAEAELGRVGTITAVRAGVLLALLEAGVTPVVSPVTLAADGQACNVNADEAATAVALALGAACLDFVSDVEGVLDAAGQPLARLTPEAAEAGIAAATIQGGMAPKVRAALVALAAGLPRVRILDLAGLAGGGGTLLSVEAAEASIGADDTTGSPASAAEPAEAGPSEAQPAPVGSIDPAAEQVDGAAILAAEKAHLLGVYARVPVLLMRGRGMQVWDADGRRYLDFTAGIAVNALGHGDPEWAAVVADQAGRLTHTSNLFTNLPMVALAERLTRSSFAEKVFFANSGTEANEAALKLARKAGQGGAGGPRTRIVAFAHGFHGRSVGALSLTFNPAYREPFGPLLPDIRFAPYNDVRAAWTAIDDTVCAVFVEPVQGEGGVCAAEPEFLRALREACDQTGALLVFDEVQCGLGRSGRLWAHEHYGVLPDLLTAAKPLAGGLPIGVLLASAGAAEVLQPGDHGSTFAAGPLVCRAACHVFDRVTAPGFLERVADVGAHLHERLGALEDPRILEIRGLGLLLGLRLSLPAAPIATAARERGLLVLTAGRDVLRLAPPLIASRDDVDRAVDILAACLAEQG